MNSKTDQVQAHRFMLGRLTSALLRVDPDAPESPLHRAYRGSTIGGIIATVICLAVLLFGLVSPGANKSWKVDGTLVVVDKTGARFLFAGGKLLPVLNFASAKLVAGNQLKVKHLDEKSLRDVPRGDPLGIIGAPDALPALASDPWQVCASIGRDKTGPTSLRIGGGGNARSFGEDEAAVVQTPDGATSLLWRGSRHRVVKDRGALDALDGVPQPVNVPSALLDALPAGPDFGPMAIAGLGTPGPRLGSVDSKIGRLYSVAGEPKENYVLTPAGLTAISQLDLRLLISDPKVRDAAYGGGEVVVTPLPGRVIGEHLSQSEVPPAAQPPRATPLHSGQGLCVVVVPNGHAPRTQSAVIDAVAADGQPPFSQPGVAAPCTKVDRIAVRPGSGVLVKPAAASGRVGDSLYLVTDTGVKYAVPPDGAKALGFDSAVSVRLPASLLAMLPTGAPLDPLALRNGGAVLPAATTCGT